MYKYSMLNIYQQTITEPVTFTGTGLHSGKKSTIRILPEKQSSIIFKRIDLKENI